MNLDILTENVLNLQEQVTRVLLTIPALRKSGSDLDSLELLQIVAAMEAEFGLDFGDRDVDPEDFRSVVGIVKVVERLRGQ